MKTLKEANKEVKAFTNYTRDESETFHVEESAECWEIYSSVFGDEEAATAYRKDDYTKEEAIKDYKENGIY